MTVWLIVLVALLIIYEISPDRKYHNSDYYVCCKKPLKKVLKDKGSSGEYAIFKSLQKVDGYKKFVFNTYLLRGNSSTEVDVIMIHQNGIFVFESKNYTGKIVGSIKGDAWKQLLGNYSTTFYSPLKQNRTHISMLRDYLKSFQCDEFYSIVVFGKNVSKIKLRGINEDYEYVSKLTTVRDLVKQIISSTEKVLSIEDVDIIYNRLLGMSGSRVNDTTKKTHIENIRRKNYE